jgi:leucyl/phenylalanyl-tRNA--protein transferase
MTTVLSTKLLLAAYSQGIFPMAINQGRQIAWFSPDPRALIPLDERFHIPHGLARVLKRKRFEISFDTDFDGVIQACATAHGSTWISGEILRSYRRLHREGHAHSVEARLDGKLSGGLYGVHLQGAFFGESMFSHATDSSKVALVALVERLRARKFTLLDTQWLTPHLAQFGTYEMPKADYLRLLGKALQRECEF